MNNNLFIMYYLLKKRKRNQKIIISTPKINDDLESIIAGHSNNTDILKFLETAIKILPNYCDSGKNEFDIILKTLLSGKHHE